MTRNQITSGWSESSQGADVGSFADVLRMVRVVLPAALIDDAGWERLAARAGTLPPSAVDAMFGFECRLDNCEASADLLLSVPLDAPFADALIRADLADGASSLPRLLSALKGTRSRCMPVVDLVALEYDVVGVDRGAAPGVFLRSTAESGYADPCEPTAAIALAAGWNEDRSEQCAVARVLAALPPGAAVRWAGAFPGRRRAVRLLIRALGDGVAAFLARVGWRGDVTAVEEILARFGASGLDNHVFALDVADGRVAARVGLELSRLGSSSPDWQQALQMMVGEGWSLPEKAAALSRATRSERIFSPGGVSELHCGIHHIKVAVQGGNDSVRAKGYIACVLRPLR